MRQELISFVLNEKPVELRVDPGRKLVNVLREELGLTGTKEGCGKGDCGSCGVLLDGKFIQSCLLPVSKVRGKKVTTIEAMGSPDKLHPLQKAFIEAGAVQCGFCTPGMIIAATALLHRNPRPSRQDIIRAMNHNLCRCTGYAKIIEAVVMAAAVMRGEAAFPAEEKLGGVGCNVALIDAVEKVCGLSPYAADMNKEGMLYAKVLRASQAHAEISRIDISKAISLPGVAAVITAKDVPGENSTGPVIKDQPVLASDRVRHQGEPLVALAANSLEEAEKAVAAVHVEYKPLKACFDPVEALKDDALAIKKNGNLLLTRRIVRGDIERGFAEADLIVDKVYTTPFNEHAYLEPEAGLSYLDERGRLVVASGCQAPHYTQQEVARILGLPRDKVRVIQATTGGGFGGKLELSGQGVLALLASKTGKPVKYVYSREESFLASGKRHPFVMRYTSGVTRQGRLTALKVEMVANTGAYASFGPGVITRAAIHATGPYQVPNVLIEGKLVYTNNPSCTAMRGFGTPQVAFAVESQMDILAHSLGMEPLSFRLVNAFDEGSVTATGQTFPGPVTIKNALSALKATYESWQTICARSKSALLKPGVGLASMWFGIGKTGMDNRSEVWLKVDEDGRVHLLEAAADIGQGSRTVLAQIVAQELNIGLNRLVVSVADTALAPDADFTCASRQTLFSGGAAKKGAALLKAALAKLAAARLNGSPDDIDLAGGFAFRRADPGRKLSFKELARFAREQGVELAAQASFDLPFTCELAPDTGQGLPYPTYTFGAQLAFVQVNLSNGQVRVLKMAAAQDVGRAINPKSVEGQLEGGMVMGIGFALKEEFAVGRTENYSDYPIPTFKDTPEMTIILIEEPDPLGPFGAKGIGESALIPVAPAITNAIYQACGVRVYDLPAKPEKIMTGLNRARENHSPSR